MASYSMLVLQRGCTFQPEGPTGIKVMGKVMVAGRCSKTVGFVAILALLTFGALATASAQSADIKAIDKAFQDHYAHGNYPAAHTDAQELERRVKARFGTDHPGYAVALNKLGIVFLAEGKYSEAEGLFKARVGDPRKGPGCEPLRSGPDH
jgi:Tetratricopeptide repeat